MTIFVEITHTHSHLMTLLVLILLLMKDNDFPTEMRAFNIKAKKRDLGKAKREIRKKVADLKEVSENVIFLAIEHSRRHALWSTAPQRRRRKISTRHSRSSNSRPRSLQACSNSARQWMDWCTGQLMSEQCRTLQCCDGKTKCYNRPTNKNKTTGPHLLWVVPRVWLYTSGRGERYFMFQILVKK